MAREDVTRLSRSRVLETQRANPPRQTVLLPIQCTFVWIAFLPHVRNKIQLARATLKRRGLKLHIANNVTRRLQGRDGHTLEVSCHSIGPWASLSGREISRDWLGNFKIRDART